MHTLKSQLIKMLKLEGNMWFSLDCMTSIKSNLNYDTEDWIVASMVFFQLTRLVFSIYKFLLVWLISISLFLLFIIQLLLHQFLHFLLLLPLRFSLFLSYSFLSLSIQSNPAKCLFLSLSLTWKMGHSFLSLRETDGAGPGSPEDSAHPQLNFMIWTRLYSLEHVRNMSGVMLHPR